MLIDIFLLQNCFQSFPRFHFSKRLIQMLINCNLLKSWLLLLLFLILFMYQNHSLFPHSIYFWFFFWIFIVYNTISTFWLTYTFVICLQLNPLTQSHFWLFFTFLYTQPVSRYSFRRFVLIILINSDIRKPLFFLFLFSIHLISHILTVKHKSIFTII